MIAESVHLSVSLSQWLSKRYSGLLAAAAAAQRWDGPAIQPLPAAHRITVPVRRDSPQRESLPCTTRYREALIPILDTVAIIVILENDFFQLVWWLQWDGVANLVTLMGNRYTELILLSRGRGSFSYLSGSVLMGHYLEHLWQKRLFI